MNSYSPKFNPGKQRVEQLNVCHVCGTSGVDREHCKDCEDRRVSLSMSGREHQSSSILDSVRQSEGTAAEGKAERRKASRMTFSDPSRPITQEMRESFEAKMQRSPEMRRMRARALAIKAEDERIERLWQSKRNVS